MTLLQTLALVAFLCAAVLAAVAHRLDGRAYWAVLVAVGLALWLLSTTKVLAT